MSGVREIRWPKLGLIDWIQWAVIAAAVALLLLPMTWPLRVTVALLIGFTGYRLWPRNRLLALRLGSAGELDVCRMDSADFVPARLTTWQLRLGALLMLDIALSGQPKTRLFLMPGQLQREDFRVLRGWLGAHYGSVIEARPP